MQNHAALAFAIFVMSMTGACIIGTPGGPQNAKVDPESLSTGTNQTLFDVTKFEPPKNRETPKAKRTGTPCSSLQYTQGVEFGKTEQGKDFLIVPLTPGKYGCAVEVRNDGIGVAATIQVEEDKVHYTVAWMFEKSSRMRSSNISMTIRTPDGHQYTEALTLLDDRDSISTTLGQNAAIDGRSVLDFIRANHENIEIHFSIMPGPPVPDDIG